MKILGLDFGLGLSLMLANYVTFLTRFFREEEEHIVEIRKTEEDDVVIKIPVEVCNKALDMKNFQLALDKAKEGDEDVKIKWANKKKKGSISN